MSALKRTPQRKAVWLQPGKIPDPPSSFQTDVLAYRGAETALAKLKRPGLNEELLWRKLWELACRADESELQANQWYHLPGLPLHTLRRFPNQVRRWAAEIKRMTQRIHSDSAYGNPAHSLPLFLELQLGHSTEAGIPKRVLPEALKQRILERSAELSKLTDLPDLLRLYADYIEGVCKLTAHLAPKAPVRYKANMIFAFVDYVKKVTGRPHFPEIAALLEAAYYAAHGSEKIVDAHNLGMQYRRSSHQK